MPVAPKKVEPETEQLRGGPAITAGQRYFVFACGVTSALLTLVFLAAPSFTGAELPGLSGTLNRPMALLELAAIAFAGAAWFFGNQRLRHAGVIKLPPETVKLARMGRAAGISLATIWLLWEGLRLWVTGPALLKFFLVAVAVVSLLTGVVRLGRLRVNSDLSYSKAVGLTALFIALVVGVWWFITRGGPGERLVQPLILPSPMEVLNAFIPLHLQQGLVRSALYSWLRVTVGFGLATLVAVPLGVYMATFPPVAAFFRPLSLAGAYVPIVVFIPLSMTWFGLGEAQKIGFLFIACFVALLPLVIKDIADVPSAFLDVAVTKGASQWQLVRHVLFPVAKANIWDHLRGVYGVGWGWIIMAEILVLPEYGLGGLIEVSNRRSQTGSIFAIIVVIVLIAVACDRIWRWGGELLFPYRRRE